VPLIQQIVNQTISAKLQAAGFPAQDKDGNNIIVHMVPATADVWAQAIGEALVNILTVQADVVNNQGVPVPVQVVPGTGTGATVIPVIGKVQ
jgi:hypothetical protein